MRSVGCWIFNISSAFAVLVHYTDEEDLFIESVPFNEEEGAIKAIR